MVRIRRYRQEDCPQLAQLFYDTVHCVNARDYAREQLDAWAAGDVDLTAWDARYQNSFTLIAEKQGAIVGFANMDRQGVLDMLYVHKNTQREGIASLLCDALESAVPTEAYSTYASITARPFFEKRGYVVEKQQQVSLRGQVLTNFYMVKKTQRPMMLYIHIPFCMKKCAYCDFVSYAGCAEKIPSYIDAVIAEMARRPSRQRVTSVFLGGGTPSILPSGELTKLLKAVARHYDLSPRCEITSEANPGTVTQEWLDAAVRGGVNRLSVGVQTVQPKLLNVIGRIHDFAQVEDTFKMARRMGISNLSADLMYALPGQTLEMWRQSLETVVQLEPQHLSCYALTVAEGTPFGDMDAQGKLPRPDEDEEMAMQAATADVLAGHGLYQYEVSNYARPGYACRHNVGYWTRRDYIGLGCAAHSLEGSLRRSNDCDLGKYISGADFDAQEILNYEDAAFEELMLGLRMVEGVTLTPYAAALFGDKLRMQQKQGLLTYSDRHVRLTPRGFDVMNTVLAQLIP